MSRTLGPDARPETVKKEAKRWLKALRAGESEAKRRLLAVTPGAPAEPGLRDVQFALAREYGLEGWSALLEALEELALARRSLAERAEIVARSATWAGDRAGAVRVLHRWPEIRKHDLFAAIVTGDLAEVERRLAADPEAATRKAGPLEREPLLYLAYARLPGGELHALDIARLLLDRGADPNARFFDDWGNPFTVLTGVIGQGEGDQPPHPRAEALARLLLERGADPYDTQALYDTSITRDDPTWLEVLWNESERRGLLERWHTAEGTDGILNRSALDYLLGNAVAYNHLARAEWLLRHGANPNALHAYSARPLRVEALVYGYAAMAALLERFGAEASPLEGHAAFQAACLQLDRKTAEALVRHDPGCLENAEPMRIAARRGRVDIVALLLELGMDVDVTDASEIRGLQDAIAGNSIEVVRLLVSRGADIDRMTKHYGGALGFAAHFQRTEIAALLAPLSRDVHNLTALGMQERLAELFAASPVVLLPQFYVEGYAYGAGGSLIVGTLVTDDGGYFGFNHAALWQGSSYTFTDLNPNGSCGSCSPGSSAYGTDGTSIAGSSGSPLHAFLWRLSQLKSPVDLNPAGSAYSEAYAVRGAVQGGYAYSSATSTIHAVLWHGTAASAVDLTPSTVSSAYTTALGANSQVGCGTPVGQSVTHALLWHGTAASMVDLHPSGFTDSCARAAQGKVQVGYGHVAGSSTLHALLWNGNAKTAVDLQQYLPGAFTSSEAYAIDKAGDVLGSAFSSTTGSWHVVQWIP